MFKVDEEMVDLTLTAAGKHAPRFAVNVSNKLFTADELKNGMLSPQKSTKSRKSLSPRRAQLLKGMYYVTWNN